MSVETMAAAMATAGATSRAPSMAATVIGAVATTWLRTSIVDAAIAISIAIATAIVVGWAIVILIVTASARWTMAGTAGVTITAGAIPSGTTNGGTGCRLVTGWFGTVVVGTATTKAATSTITTTINSHSPATLRGPITKTKTVSST